MEIRGGGTWGGFIATASLRRIDERRVLAGGLATFVGRDIFGRYPVRVGRPVFNGNVGHLVR